VRSREDCDAVPHGRVEPLEPARRFAETGKKAEGANREDGSCERSEIPERGPGTLEGAETCEVDGEAILHRLRDIGARCEDDGRAARHEHVPPGPCCASHRREGF
jgi:hypothetical protein